MRRAIGLLLLICCLGWGSARAKGVPADTLAAPDKEGALAYVALGDSCLRTEHLKEAESAY
jgi:hypothetical protein